MTAEMKRQGRVNADENHEACTWMNPRSNASSYWAWLLEQRVLKPDRVCGRDSKCGTRMRETQDAWPRRRRQNLAGELCMPPQGPASLLNGNRKEASQNANGFCASSCAEPESYFLDQCFALFILV